MKFAALAKSLGLPSPETEYSFDRPLAGMKARRWRFDYAWPERRIALEVEGGIWSGGRHTRAAGFLKDMEKYNEAAAQGWRIIRTTPDRLLTLRTVELLKRAMNQ